MRPALTTQGCVLQHGVVSGAAQVAGSVSHAPLRTSSVVRGVEAFGAEVVSNPGCARRTACARRARLAAGLFASRGQSSTLEATAAAKRTAVAATSAGRHAREERAPPMHHVGEKAQTRVSAGALQTSPGRRPHRPGWRPPPPPGHIVAEPHPACSLGKGVVLHHSRRPQLPFRWRLLRRPFSKRCTLGPLLQLVAS